MKYAGFMLMAMLMAVVLAGALYEGSADVMMNI
jgi:hypothetical protein